MISSEHRSRRGAVRHRLSLQLGALLTAVLVVFHAVLFWERVRDLSIFEPLVLLQWLLAILLIVAMRHLHNRQVSLLRGRQALAFWLLILLLHLMAVPPAAEWAEEHSGLLLALPVSYLLLALARRTLKLLPRSAPRPTSRVIWQRRRRPSRAPTDTGHPFRVFPRPPPFLESDPIG